MTKSLANVEVATDSFSSWITRTNDLVTALRNEVITANSTSATPGSTTGNAEVIGTLSANTLKATNIQGGNVSTNTLLGIYGNVSVYSNSTGFTTFKVTGGPSVGTGVYANADEIITVSNTSLRGNTSYTAVYITGNSSYTNLALNATAGYITTNLSISGGLHNITGNVNVDTGTLFIDSVNNRVGISNTTPNAPLTVTGAANVSGNTAVGGDLNVSGNTNVTGNTALTGAASLSNTLIVTGLATLNGGLNTTTANASTRVNVGANASLTTTYLSVGNSTVNTFINSISISTYGNLFVTNTTTLSNTALIQGLLTANAGLVVNGTANATSSINVGANVNLSTSVINVSNSVMNTAVTVGQVYVGNTTSYTNVNYNNITTNWNLSSNSLGIYHTGTVNAASLTVGTTFTANATLVNAAAINIVNQVNTSTLYATTSANVGSAVLANTSGVYPASNTSGSALGNTTSRWVVNANTGNFSGTLSVSGAANVTSTLGIGGAANALSTFGVTGAANLASTLGVSGAANLFSTLGVSGAANLFSTLGVSGAITASAKFTGTEVAANNLTINSNTYVVDVSSNSNIGTDTGNPILIYSFPKASYSSAQLNIQVKNSGNVQISTVILTHDGTTPTLTSFGTVNAPAGSNLGVYSCAMNSANVEVKLLQTLSSSAVTVVANLIK